MVETYVYVQNLVAEMTQSLVKPRKGQGLIEYVLIVVLIALAAFVAMQLLGGTINGVFNNANNKLKSGTS